MGARSQSGGAMEHMFELYGDLQLHIISPQQAQRYSRSHEHETPFPKIETEIETKCDPEGQHTALDAASTRDARFSFECFAKHWKTTQRAPIASASQYLHSSEGLGMFIFAKHINVVRLAKKTFRLLTDRLKSTIASRDAAC